jgi:hypothetical protein
MAAEKDALPRFEDFLDAMEECQVLAASARGAVARLRESEHAETSDEIQDAERLLGIVEGKAKLLLTFLDVTSSKLHISHRVIP